MADTSSSDDVANLRYPGGEVDLKIVRATEGSDGIGRGSLLAKTGYTTYDGGFGNTSATKGASDITTTVIGMAQTNTEAVFAFTQSLMGVKSLPEAFELMNAHARKQFEVLSSQTQDLATLTHKVAVEAVEPIAAGAAKAFKPGL